MTVQPGDMFHYIGTNKLSEDDYVIAIASVDDDDSYWKLLEVVTGKVVEEWHETLLNEDIYRKVA